MLNGIPRRAGQRRVVVIARPDDLSGGVGDAFMDRHLRMVGWLADEYDVSVILLRPPDDTAAPARVLTARVVDDIPMTDDRNDRVARLARTARRMIYDPLAEWERRLSAAVRASGAHAGVTLGPWLNVQYRAVVRSVPTLCVLEEDLSRMPEIAAQSRQARLLRAVEAVGHRRAGMRPRCVVVITPAEAAWARRTFMPGRVASIPYTLDPALWPLAEGASGPGPCLVVGALAQPRNADGLAAVLAALQPAAERESIRVRLVSARGVAESLVPYVSAGWVELAPPLAGDPAVAAEYARAGVALVPATRATGFKTTVLQAWQCGTPVVCSPAVGATLGATGRSAVEIGATPAEQAELIRALLADEGRRAEMARRGLGLAREEYDDATARTAFLAEVEALMT